MRFASSSTLSALSFIQILPLVQYTVAAPLLSQVNLSEKTSTAKPNEHTTVSEQHTRPGRRKPPRQSPESWDAFLSTNRHPLLDGYGRRGWERDIIVKTTQQDVDSDDKVVGITTSPIRDPRSSSTRTSGSEYASQPDISEDKSYLRFLFSIIPPSRSRRHHHSSPHCVGQHVDHPYPRHHDHQRHHDRHRHRRKGVALRHRLIALKNYSWDELRLFTSATPSPAYMSYMAGKFYKERIAPMFAFVFCRNPTGYLMGGLFLGFLVLIALREYTLAKQPTDADSSSGKPTEGQDIQLSEEEKGQT